MGLGVAGWAFFPAGVGAVFGTAHRAQSFRAGTGIALSVVLTAAAIAMVLLLHIDSYVQLFFFPAFAAARLSPDRLAIGGVALVAGTAGVVASAEQGGGGHQPRPRGRDLLHGLHQCLWSVSCSGRTAPCARPGTSWPSWRWRRKLVTASRATCTTRFWDIP